ncbi:hypothetical protein CAPTEDRAFT_208992 [Capitella teleta]|uniref:Uncharacterized protein n=1 Tax=Capitella teleta TaxID=283909 RepID=R7U5Y7_CAPTE|nr:hypothetical protein CAPTEDRAFT_208992 [Capitella teleta]|eukprot:ELT98570.1 hypothetical protein CAPTEDRAFT_208992 [Capitella teleta]
MTIEPVQTQCELAPKIANIGFRGSMLLTARTENRKHGLIWSAKEGRKQRWAYRPQPLDIHGEEKWPEMKLKMCVRHWQEQINGTADGIPRAEERVRGGENDCEKQHPFPLPKKGKERFHVINTLAANFERGISSVDEFLPHYLTIFFSSILPPPDQIILLSVFAGVQVINLAFVV